MPQDSCQLQMPHDGIQLTGHPESPVKGTIRRLQLALSELAALRRKHIDATAGLVRIEAAVVELTNGHSSPGRPMAR